MKRCAQWPVSMLSLTMQVPLISTASHGMMVPLLGMTMTSPGTRSVDIASSISVLRADRRGKNRGKKEHEIREESNVLESGSLQSCKCSISRAQIYVNEWGCYTVFSQSGRGASLKGEDFNFLYANLSQHHRNVHHCWAEKHCAYTATKCASGHVEEGE